MVVDSIADEDWLPVAGYEGVYDVSSLGRVRSIGHRRRRVLRPNVITNGYHQVDLRVAGTRRGKLAHRLVAEAFIGPCPDHLQVNHKNGDKEDNRLDNLEYVTPLENVQHAYRTLNCATTRARGEANGQSKLTGPLVAEARRRSDAGESYSSISRSFGVGEMAVSRCVRRLTWKHV